MNDPMGFMIPWLGVIWLISFLVGWIVLPYLRHVKEQRKMLNDQRDQLHRLTVQIPHIVEFIHDIRDQVRTFEERVHMELSKLHHDAASDRHEAARRAEAIQRPMPGSNTLVVGSDLGELRAEMNGRITSVEAKLDELTRRAETPEEEVVEENTDPSEPVQFEVYREALLRLWDGEVSIEEHCNEWRGRLVLPRPGRKARA